MNDKTIEHSYGRSFGRQQLTPISIENFARQTHQSCAGVLPQKVCHWFCSQRLSSGTAFGINYQMTGWARTLTQTWTLPPFFLPWNPRLICVEFEFFLGPLKKQNFGNWGQLWVDTKPHPPEWPDWPAEPSVWDVEINSSNESSCFAQARVKIWQPKAIIMWQHTEHSTV